MDYIITGLPRCKTAWLAVFFNQKGIVDCWHEMLAEVGLKAALEFKQTEPTVFQGCSDSGVMLHFEDFVAAYPNTKWVHVDRPIADVIESGIKAGIPAENLEFGCERQAEFLELMTGAKNFIRLPFDFEVSQLMEVCAFIGIPWDQKHYNVLRRFNVQMSQGHVDFLNLSGAKL